MDAILKRLKSRTYWLAGLIGAIAPTVLDTFPLLRNFLGEHYGLALFGAGITIAIAREITTKPISEK